MQNPTQNAAHPIHLPGVRHLVHAVETIDAHALYLTAPALVVAGLIGTVSMMTNYTLLQQIPHLEDVWAVSLAFGLDLAFFSLFGYLFALYLAGRRVTLELVVLGAVVAFLGWVLWQTSTAFQAHEALNADTLTALRYALTDQVSWLQERGLLNVVLIAVGAAELKLARLVMIAGQTIQESPTSANGPQTRSEAPASRMSATPQVAIVPALYEPSDGPVSDAAMNESLPRKRTYAARAATEAVQLDLVRALVEEAASRGEDVTTDDVIAFLAEHGCGRVGRGTADKRLAVVLAERRGAFVLSNIRD